MCWHCVLESKFSKEHTGGNRISSVLKSLKRAPILLENLSKQVFLKVKK